MKREWCLAVGSLFLTLLLVFVVVETYYWFKKKGDWVAEGLMFDPNLGWINVPRLEYINQGRQFKHNSYGFRSPEPDNSRKQILLIGDSVTYGIGLDDSETIASFLEGEFHNWQTLNLGVNGFGIDQYYLLLDRHLSNLNPSYVAVVIYTGNDLLDIGRGDLSGIRKPFFLKQGDSLINLNPRLSRFDCSSFWSRSWLASLVGRNRLMDSFCNRQEMEFSEAKKLAKNLFIKIDDLVKQHGAKTLFVLSPSRTAVEWAHCSLKKPIRLCDRYNAEFQANYELFRKILERSSLELLDFENEFLLKFSENIEGLADFYNFGGQDIHHFSPKGSLMMAKAIANKIKEDSISVQEEMKTKVSREELRLTKGLIEQALILFRESKAGDALRLLEKNLRPIHYFVDGYFLLGLIYEKIEALEKSISAFRLLIRLDPENSFAYNLLGRALVRAKSFSEALTPLNRAIEISIDYPDAYFNLATAFQGLGQMKKAFRNLLLAEELYKLKGNQVMYSFVRQMVLRWETNHRLNQKELRANLPTAETLEKVSNIRMLKRLLHSSPENIHWRQRLGSTLIEISDFENAIKQYKEVVKLFPQSAFAYNTTERAPIATDTLFC